ncbi:hypothetical protein C8J56DRAFT_1027096 [Mycena floridula]|nr:hypothetical protein C8J56DRAFT_1027096 [Mycena floridula]
MSGVPTPLTFSPSTSRHPDYRGLVPDADTARPNVPVGRSSQSDNVYCDARANAVPPPSFISFQQSSPGAPEHISGLRASVWAHGPLHRRSALPAVAALDRQIALTMNLLKPDSQMLWDSWDEMDEMEPLRNVCSLEMRFAGYYMVSRENLDVLFGFMGPLFPCLRTSTLSCRCEVPVEDVVRQGKRIFGDLTIVEVLESVAPIEGRTVDKVRLSFFASYLVDPSSGFPSSGLFNLTANPSSSFDMSFIFALDQRRFLFYITFVSPRPTTRPGMGFEEARGRA